MTEQKAREMFVEALEKAQRSVNFGPLDGFNGYGCDKVWRGLPDWFKIIWDNMKFSHKILVESSNSTIYYAESLCPKFFNCLAILLKSMDIKE